MGSDISRDHIALEVMKILIKVSAHDTTPIVKKIINWLFGTGYKNTSLPAWENIASKAYGCADAMIAEREKNKEG